jgi:hemin uptake protein HemP
MQPASVDPATDDAGRHRGSVRRIDTETLLQREREIVIVHRGQEYHLRVTKSDKLILTK